MSPKEKPGTVNVPLELICLMALHKFTGLRDILNKPKRTYEIVDFFKSYVNC